LIHMQNVAPNGRTTKDHFELVVRLQQSRSSHPSDAALRLRAQALVKDILMSRLDVDAEINAHEYVHSQGFGDFGRVLAASRALQVAFEGFRAVVPTARANLSVVLDSSEPDETASAHNRLSVEQKDLLDSAKPSQVLITQAFYDRIAHYQPALRSSPLRTGIYEFLWTSEQRLGELQAEAEFMPTLIQPTVAPEAVAVIVQPVKPASQPRWKEPDKALAPIPEPISDDQPPVRWLSIPRALAIGSAIAILIAVGYLVHSHVPGNPPRPVVQSTRPIEQPAVIPTQGPPPTARSTSKMPVGPAAGSALENGAPPATVKPPKPAGVTPDTASSNWQHVLKPTTKPRGCTLDSDEIPSYLNLAERYRSRGNYDRAISNYNIVLGCEPGNRQALAGLRNAEDAEKYPSR
jgi:hypothetical protein